MKPIFNARLFAACFFASLAFSAFCAEKKICVCGADCEAKIDSKNREIFILAPYFVRKGEIFPLSAAKAEPFENFSRGFCADLRECAEIKSDSGEIWKVRAGYQIPESDFSKWHEEKIPGFVSIGEVKCPFVPGEATGGLWATSDEAFGTTGSKKWPTFPIVLDDGTCAVKMESRSVVGVLAAGSLFCGSVSRSISLKQILGKADSRRSLIDFGIPFEANPKGFRLKFRYSGRGDKCVLAGFLENRDGGQKKIVKCAGYCEATDSAADSPNVAFLSEPDSCGMRTIEIHFSDDDAPPNGEDYLPEGAVFARAPVTHISLIFSSSYKGDFLKGKKGASLVISSLELVY